MMQNNNRLYNTINHMRHVYYVCVIETQNSS